MFKERKTLLRKNFVFLREIKKLHKQGYENIVGVDEAGRGPLAGPVVAGAVGFSFLSLRGSASWRRRSNPAGTPRDRFASLAMTFNGIKDSKKLSTKQREEWYKILTEHSDIKWGVGIVSEKIIDKINILEATKLAMRKAIQELRIKNIDYLIVDGNFVLDFKYPENSSLEIQRTVLGQLKQKAIPKADEKIFQCAAASIIAKVTRDRIMLKMHKKYPQYGFDKHKGYGTKGHLKALRKYGACKIHRITFSPIATFLAAKKLRKKLLPNEKF